MQIHCSWCWSSPHPNTARPWHIDCSGLTPMEVNHSRNDFSNKGPGCFNLVISGLNAGKDHWRQEPHSHQEIDFWPSDHFRSRFQALWPVRWWKLSWATTGSRINGVLHDGKSPGWIYSQDMSRSHKHRIDLKQQSIKHKTIVWWFWWIDGLFLAQVTAGAFQE